MAVRRLYHIQPASFAFTPENEAWVKRELTKYPPGRERSAVIPVLWRAQEQEGWVTEPAIRVVGRMLDMPAIQVLEIATFYTMFHLAPVGRKAHIKVCGTTPCMLRGSDDLIAHCQDRIAGHQHEVSADGDFSWEEVECLGACVNAPMIQIDADTYEDLTVATFAQLIDDIAAGRAIRPGPQIDRMLSAPEGGLTTLKDIQDRPSAAAKTASLADVAGKEPAPAANVREAPAPTDIVAKAGARDQVPESRTEKATTSDPRVPPPQKVPDEFKPELLTGARDGRPDDLTRIVGIGPKLAQMLNGMGVYHFDQIANWTDSNLAWVDANLSAFKGRAIRDRWVQQARDIVGVTEPDTAGGMPGGGQ
ncbi:MAG: NADH-quinone oxidoreductase subunit NuoE [Thermomicrobiales bacterium]|nr:NADH-quinone oxidoreductase subunit NuoE [Thermomicrobiales bacterium]